MIGPNTFIYIALIAGVLFTIYSLCLMRSLPLLAELFSLMLSAAAAYSGVELCYAVLEDQKLTIVLGSVAVFWVALLTAINLVKGVAGRAEIQKKMSVVPQQENA